MVWRDGSLVEGVAGNGQEHVEEGVVSREGEEDKVDGVFGASAGYPARGIDGSVHYIVPVLLRQHLKTQEER